MSTKAFNGFGGDWTILTGGGGVPIPGDESSVRPVPFSGLIARFGISSTAPSLVAFFDASWLFEDVDGRGGNGFGGQLSAPHIECEQGTDKVKPPTLSFPVSSPLWPVDSLTDDTDVRGVASGG